MMNRKRKKKINYLLILLLVVSLGYALLKANLKIDGLTNINSMQWDVHFENVELANGSVSTTAPTISDDKTTVTYNFNLKLPGDYYEFTVDAVNNGSRDAMISNLTPKFYSGSDTTPITLPSYLKYSIEYPNGVAVENNDTIPAKTKRVIRVRIEYIKNAPEEPSSGISFSGEIDEGFKEADDDAKNPDNTVVANIPGKDISEGDEPKVGDNLTIANTTGTVNEPCTILKVKYVDGEEVVDCLAKYNLSAYATAPASVQFMQDRNEAPNHQGGAPNRIGFSDSTYWENSVGLGPDYTYQGVYYSDIYDYYDSEKYEYPEYDPDAPFAYVYDESETSSGRIIDPYDPENKLCNYYTDKTTKETYCYDPRSIATFTFSPIVPENTPFCRKGSINKSCEVDSVHPYVSYGNVCDQSTLDHTSSSDVLYSTIGDIMKGYKEALEALDVEVISVRPPSIQEVNNKKLDDSVFMSNIASSSGYWLGSAYDGNGIFYVDGYDNDGELKINSGEPVSCSNLGARPVITIKLSSID